MPTTVPPPRAQIRVELRGSAGERARDDATAVVEAVLASHAMADEGARVRLAASLCGAGPALMQVNLHVCGTPARIQVPGPTVSATIANAAARLDAQLHRLTRGWQAWPWPDPLRRPLAAPGEAEIARVKDVRLRIGTPWQATAVLDTLDYDVHLFTDAETDEDAVVYRAGQTDIRLSRQHTRRPPSTPHGLLSLRPLVTVNPRMTPALTTDQAAHRLGECWLPFIFYNDPASGRGSLLYRRYDGDLTLVRPITRTVWQ